MEARPQWSISSRFEIERRLDRVLRLIRTGRYSTPMLADEIGVSIPTISRCVTALRARGYDIKANKHGNGWRYAVAQKAGTNQPREQACSLKGRAD